MMQQTETHHQRVVLITGASGFIGSHLVKDLLSRGYFVKAIVRSARKSIEASPSLEIIETALESPALVPALLRGIDTVIHCAARVHRMRETSRDPIAEYRNENVDNTLSLANKCLAAGVKKFIFFSTVKVMGDFDRTEKILTENDPPSPTDQYGISKFEAEEGLKRLFNGHHESTCVILRLPMVYGPGNKGNMLSLLAAARRKMPLPLKGASGKRSTIYVGNICDAVCAIMDRQMRCTEQVAVYNLTDGADYTSGELYSAIYQKFNGANGTFYFPPGLMRMLVSFSGKSKAIVSRLFDDYRFSSVKFQTAYQWKPVFSLQEGIAATVRWYQTECIS